MVSPSNGAEKLKKRLNLTLKEAHSNKNEPMIRMTDTVFKSLGNHSAFCRKKNPVLRLGAAHLCALATQWIDPKGLREG
jgi:hypothetical protein